jgi:hypothetical protein
VNRKDIGSRDKKSKTLQFILYRTVDPSIKAILSAYITGPEGWKALCDKYGKHNSTTLHSLLKPVFVRERSEAFNAIKEFTNRIENQTGKKIKHLNLTMPKNTSRKRLKSFFMKKEANMKTLFHISTKLMAQQNSSIEV